MTKIDKYITFSILNVVVLVTIVFKTVINFYVFVLIVLILFIVCYLLIHKKIIKIGIFGKKYFFMVKLPMIINAFFLVNYITMTNPVKETYCYKNMIAEVGGRGSHEKGKNHLHIFKRQRL